MDNSYVDNSYVQHFKLAITSVFDCVEQGGVAVRTGPSLRVTSPTIPDMTTHEVTVVVGLTGRRTGSMVLNMTREVAVGISTAILGGAPRQLDKAVADALGSFANMIAGMAIYNLRELQLTAALPTVVWGRTETWFPSGVDPVRVEFDSDLGSFTLTYGWLDSRPAAPS